MQILRLFSQTLWLVRASLLTSIRQNYRELKELWKWCLVEYKLRESKARINDVHAEMQTFDYFFRLRLSILLLGHNDNLSTSLQAENLCAVKGQEIEKSTDEKFNLF